MDSNTSSTPARPVVGMSNIYDSVSTPVATAIKQELMAHFGKALYYRLKNGEKAIDAAQQAFIAQTFANHGITTPPVYDSAASE